MQNFWDERYSQPDYVYGKEPNAFYKPILDTLTPGKLLLPGEGEGRNSVYAATQGWQVDALDSSMEGKKKAERLAAENNVKINYILTELKNYNYPQNYYDAVALIYIHMPPHIRKEIHGKMIEALKPGGVLILEGFSKEQLSFSSGGPKDRDMLFDIDEIGDDLKALSVELLKKELVDLHEGPGHNGKGMVIRFVGRKS